MKTGNRASSLVLALSAFVFASGGLRFASAQRLELQGTWLQPTREDFKSRRAPTTRECTRASTISTPICNTKINKGRNICGSYIYRCQRCGWIGCDAVGKCPNAVQREGLRCKKCGTVGTIGSLFKKLD
jgi:hypothetical protein